MRKLMPKLLAFVLLFPLLYSCKPKEANNEIAVEKLSEADLLHMSAQQLTDVIVYDIFKPPVASRVYAYSFLAAYEALQPQSVERESMAGKLQDFSPVPEPQKNQTYAFPVASLQAFYTVGKTLTFSADRWEAYEKNLQSQFKAMNLPEDVLERSIAYGNQVAAHILAYADQDNYKVTRGYKHTISRTAGGWQPTPPTYAEACEPQWSQIRTFVLDSAAQFAPPAPAAYDLNENSQFYKLTREVYDIAKNLTDEQKEIAYFWDDNAFVTTIVGHVSYAEKKMTPPGHWIEITRTVAKDKKLNMAEATEAYALTSVALFDAFVASWDAKYKTDRIRPVTVINSTIEGDWMPFLETPAFPEYVSGHSAISAAAGRVLTHLLGDNVAFTDSTEHKYGHGVRSFTSFEQAYWETSMSRVYGGIHYRDGVEQGTYQGEKVGDWVWANLKGPSQSVIADKSAKPETLKASSK